MTTRQQPKTERTSYGHTTCGGAIIKTTTGTGITFHCAKCGKPTTPIGGNAP
jgi:hypothetical protein